MCDAIELTLAFGSIDEGSAQFGDPEEPHHRDALALTIQTEQAIAAVLRRDRSVEPARADALAHVVSAVMFLSLASTFNATAAVDDIVGEIRGHVQALLPL